MVWELFCRALNCLKTLQFVHRKPQADQEEQDELNRLAESDPAEYDRRVKEIVERQAVEAAKLKGSVAEQKKRKERVAKNKRKQKKQDAKDKDAADMKERAKQFK